MPCPKCFHYSPSWQTLEEAYNSGYKDGIHFLLSNGEASLSSWDELDFWCSVPAALVPPYHPLCADLVPYLTIHEEFQEQKSANKETVHGETDKETERAEDGEVLTSFTDVAGPKKGSSDVPKSNIHSLRFGMVQNGTHARTDITYSTVHKNNSNFIHMLSSLYFSAVGKHFFLPGCAWTSS